MLTREPWFKLREVRLKIKINTKNINWCYNKKKKKNNYMLIIVIHKVNFKYFLYLE